MSRADEPGAAPRSGTRDLVLDGVGHHYVTDAGDVVHAVAPTSLRIPGGQFVCVVGPSGCGKTTLLRVLAGFLRPSAGTARYGEEAITGPSHHRGVVFQQPSLYPWLTVRGNVELGPRFRGVSRPRRRERAEELLGMVGLERFGDAKPYELSGGMQQRAQIARVLANQPEVVLMDEPFGALDALTRERLQADLLRIQRRRRQTVFFITHSVEEAVFLGDRVLVMSPRPGRVVLDEPVDLASGLGPDVGAEMKSAPEFIAIRDRVAAAIELS
ncbi:taurine ABC transporter ATP-binding protein [Kocuria flava]|uniref:Taurine ABC transporter ATP-binding protein n=1 Tax=Kocuria flava TaxID=446860 RepID=A0A2N4T3R2_9MICC|nr:ABC transporter ATP-binding protein [Kocuria flava]PLC12871.1 taurine ABC transporter ATP-binding protein [Kocuria flava]